MSNRHHRNVHGAIMSCQNGLRVALLLSALMIFTTYTKGQEGGRTDSAAQEITSSKPPANSAGDAQNSLHRRGFRYTVHPSDTLELTFPLTPEFNQTVTVKPDGFVSLRGVGELSVAGQTVPELTDSLIRAYKPVLRDPMIYIDPKDFEKPYFVVGGQVGHPGKFDWRGDVTVTQAIAIAGGFDESAKHSQVLLFRRVSNDWAQAKVIDVKHMLSKENLHEDPILQPGDMLYVPKNKISKIKPFLPLPSVGMYASQF